ncbi:MAG: DUF5674 family protein [Candidatus Omnitrophota bacterium]
MIIRIVRDRIARSALKVLAQETYVDMIKAVADIDKGVVAFGGQMHADAQAMLLAEGFLKKDLWGFCFFVERPFSEAFDFTSHINIRPEDGNSSVRIQDAGLCQKLARLVQERIDWSA